MGLWATVTELLCRLTHVFPMCSGVIVATPLGYRNVWWGMGQIEGGAFGREIADVYYPEISTPPERKESIALLDSILRGIQDY